MATTPFDGINATLDNLNQNTLFDSDSTVEDDHSNFLLRKTLHAILEDICYNVRGFQTITTQGKKLQTQKTSSKVMKNELA